MATKLTKRIVESLKPEPDRDVFAWDSEVIGFGVRLKPTGIRSYVLKYRPRGMVKTRRVTIGKHGKWTVELARKEARRLLGEVAEGGDPALDKKETLHKPTFQDLSDRYLAQHASRKKSGVEDKRILEKDLLPRFGSRQLEEITRGHVIAALDSVAERGGIMANRTLAVLRKVFNFGIEKAICETNPCWGVKAPSKETSKDRSLSSEEIKAFWKQLSETDMLPVIQQAFRLILVTAQRPGEVARAEWSEIDQKGGWWTIPGTKTKNGLTHRVPLSTMAVEILSGLPQNRQFVFESPRKPGEPLHKDTLAHAMIRNRDKFTLEQPNGEKKVISTFTAHDLRRTVATRMAEAKISRIVLEKVLNHSTRSNRGNVTDVYDRYSYDEEKRQALETWASKLQDILKDKEESK